MGPLGSLQDMEARLHDYGREVEARVDNKLLLLDALLQEVATERQRLEHLLQESRETRTLPPPASRAA